MTINLHYIEQRIALLEKILTSHDPDHIARRLERLESLLLTPGTAKVTLTLKEVAQYTGLTQSQLYKMTAAGAIPHYKPRGKTLYFHRDEIDAWLLRKPRKPGSDEERQS